MVGNPAIGAESVIAVDGFESEAGGKYSPNSVIHSFDQGGYRTSVTLEPPDATDADS